MLFDACVLPAIDVVLAWEIPEESFAEAVTVQASLMAGIDPEEIPQHCPD